MELEGVGFDKDGRVSQSSMMGLGQLRAVVSSNSVNISEGGGTDDSENRSTLTLSLKKRCRSGGVSHFDGKRTKLPYDSTTSKTDTLLSIGTTVTTTTTTNFDNKDKPRSQQPWTSLVTHDMLKSEIINLLQSRDPTKTC